MPCEALFEQPPKLRETLPSPPQDLLSLILVLHLRTMSGLRVSDDNTILTPHTLCQRCNEICQKSILLRTLPISYETGDLNYSVEDLWEQEEEQFLHSTYPELKASYSDCHLCTMIWHIIDDVEEVRRSIRDPQSEEEDCLILVIRDDRVVSECVVGFKFGGRYLRAGLRILSASGKHAASHLLDISC